jgi:hypothetical protein
MFEAVFERSSEALLRVVRDAFEYCEEFKSRWICTDHLLLVLVNDMTAGGDDVASRGLNSMNIKPETAEKEIRERFRLDVRETETVYSEDNAAADDLQDHLAMPVEQYSGPLFSHQVVEAFKRAEEYSLFLGQEEMTQAHLLLAIIDLPEAGANKVFEELSVNLTFLRRQIMQILALDCTNTQSAPAFVETVKSGMSFLVGRYQSCVDALQDLSVRSRTPQTRIVGRPQLVHMVCVSYLGDFLATQVGFQRYLLEESLRQLATRLGSLDKEMSASIVSSGAQNMRADVRATIEHLWCNEYRVLNQMLNDAEHDLIGSVIEDLWWAQSEEIALHDLFAEAMDDHRRKHLLSLQKRRLEISQRLTSLHDRLDETIRQCFVKHPISA